MSMKKSLKVYGCASVVVAAAAVAYLALGVISVACRGTEQKLVKSEVVEDRGEFRDIIHGDFNGDGKSESAQLYRRSQDEDYEYNIYFGDASVKTLDSKTMVYAAKYLTNEGDLNGDGAHEIGVFLHCGYSYWGTYAVYTYSEGEWKELVSISHNPGWVECSMQELVRCNPENPRSVIVKEISIDHAQLMERIKYF